MKRYKNKLFAIILSVLAAISFTSCEDYEWREATLDYYETINAAPNGVIEADLPVNFNYVLVKGRYNSIDDIRYRGGKIEINTNNRIGIIRLSVSNSNVYVELDVSTGGGTYNGPRVKDFLYEVVEVVRRYGQAT
ncbi:MAG: hypothetical protein LBL79_09405, partial [Prevotella sp.]|nr:hypothetical protein [Prevotella sp.]